MNKVFRVLIGIPIILGAHTVFASQACDSLNTPKDVLECALDSHPDLVRGKGSLKQAESLGDQAAQRPNPELSARSLFGKNEGESVTGHEVNLAHTFELGGKRSARINKANAEKEQISSEFLKTKEEVYISISKILYRIRQVHAEIRTVDEALNTFERIQKQFKVRPRLAPEQEVSLSVFQLAEGDYKIRKSTLESEENALERSLEVAIGKEFPHGKDSLLPPPQKTWPELQAGGGEFRGSDFKLAISELKNAQAEMEIAKGASWPDLKLGPSVQSQSQGSNQYLTYGVNLTLPLPLYQANGGGRAVASAGLMRAEQSLELRKRELGQHRKILLNQYQKSSKALKESVSLPDIEKKHKSVERQFERGVISSSLVIEAHRQMVDFTKSQNELELNALESLWRLKVLDGSLFE
ncbi:MAG: TolC family protein [Bdellovibrionaceae bacterium]|nr:TolC family protein [Pseudobdellovibrionaceae bacterium]